MLRRWECPPASSALPGTRRPRDITEPSSSLSCGPSSLRWVCPRCSHSSPPPIWVSTELNTVCLQVYLLLPFNQACESLKYKDSSFRFCKKKNRPTLLAILICLQIQTVKKENETYISEQRLDIWWISSDVKELSVNCCRYDISAVVIFFKKPLKKVESISHSIVSNSLWPHGLQPAKILCPWDFPGKNTGVGSHSLLQGIFSTQG